MDKNMLFSEFCNVISEDVKEIMLNERQQLPEKLPKARPDLSLSKSQADKYISLTVKCGNVSKLICFSAQTYLPQLLFW